MLWAGACAAPEPPGVPGKPSPPDQDGDGFVVTADCDDARADRNPGATEVCNDQDDDCDGRVDDADPDRDPASATPWFADADDDGFGDPYVGGAACEPPPGTVANGDDCDDAHPGVSPAALERCGLLDEDCDGLVDEADADLPDTGLWTGFVDADGDGHGDALRPVSPACVAPDGAAALGDDCDDADPERHPDAPTWCADGIDQDCDDVDEPCHAALTGTVVVGDAPGRWQGAEAFGWFGYAVMSADLDGDGDGDLLVGEAAANVDDINTGRVWMLTDPLAGGTTAGAPFVNGESGEDKAGGALAYLGDPDGDGTVDWVLAARLNDQGAVDAGCVYLLSGTPVDAPLGAAPEIRGTEEDEQVGDTLADGGDFDGDGSGDVVVASRLSDAGGDNRGAVWWLTAPTQDTSLGDVDTVITGVADKDQAGVSVASADIDADGVTDLLVGAHRADGAGLDRGRADWLLGPLVGTDLDGSSATAWGADDEDFAGNAVALGDALGTGQIAAAIGADGSDLGATDGGSIWLVPIPPVGSPTAEEVALARVDGVADEQIGDVLDLGDVDGDGVEDLVLGSEGSDLGAPDGGAAMLFYGPMAGTYVASAADAIFASDLEGEALGARVLVLADSDGDGAGEVVIGAWLSGRFDEEAGVVYVFPGGPQ